MDISWKNVDASSASEKLTEKESYFMNLGNVEWKVLLGGQVTRPHESNYLISTVSSAVFLIRHIVIKNQQ